MNSLFSEKFTRWSIFSSYFAVIGEDFWHLGILAVDDERIYISGKLIVVSIQRIG